jgi:hypothetical protein
MPDGTLTSADVLLAFRQAKHALYHEHNLGLIDIARAERSLPALLERVRKRLRSDWFQNVPLGRVWIVPKRAKLADEEEGLSTIDEHAKSRIEHIDVRVHLQPSMELAILEVFWLWAFGPALECLLGRRAFANRLNLTSGRTQVDRDTRWLFRYWPSQYSRFRDRGLRAAKTALRTSSERCTVVSLDVAGFYDQVDAGFLISGEFCHLLMSRATRAGVEFDLQRYVTLTSQLLDVFGRVRTESSSLTGITSPRGIPIGCLTSKVISNVALSTLDDIVISRPSVTYYGRYVDDVLIVATPQGASDEPIPTLLRRFLPLRQATEVNDELRLDEGKLGRNGSVLTIQRKKLRVHALRGRSGRDFIETIARDFRMVASERRAVLYEGQRTLTRLTGLVVGTDGQMPVHLLREADRVKIERYAAMGAVSKVGEMVELVDRSDARRTCRTQLTALANACTSAEHWVDFVTLAMRILGVAVRADDVITVRRILRRLEKRLLELQDVSLPLHWNGTLVVRASAKARLADWLTTSELEALASAAPVRDSSRPKRPPMVPTLRVGRRVAKWSTVRRLADLLRRTELRAISREDDIRPWDRDRSTRVPRGWHPLNRTARLSKRTAPQLFAAEEFLTVCKNLQDIVYGPVNPLQLFLMTRPPIVFDIAERWARSGRQASELISVVGPLRGTRTFPNAPIRSGYRQGSSSRGEARPRIENCWVVLGNLDVDLKWFYASLREKPHLSHKRAEALASVINRARDLRLRHLAAGKSIPILVVLPELSMPRAWLRYFANSLLGEGIGIVTGLEYSVQQRFVTNEAVGVFPSGGRYSGEVQVWQKTHPAREEQQILSAKGFVFREAQKAGPRSVVRTAYGAVSVLICSEMLDVTERSELLGRVDLLAVPAWNRDTATFDHTVQTTAGDLHCYVALANNAHYSDCRLYVPRKAHHERDAGRLMLSRQNEAIAVEVNAGELRSFQLASLDPRRRVPKSLRDMFKPLPPGYVYKRDL